MSEENGDPAPDAGNKPTGSEPAANKPEKLAFWADTTPEEFRAQTRGAIEEFHTKLQALPLRPSEPGYQKVGKRAGVGGNFLIETTPTTTTIIDTTKRPEQGIRERSTTMIVFHDKPDDFEVGTLTQRSGKGDHWRIARFIDGKFETSDEAMPVTERDPVVIMKKITDDLNRVSDNIAAEEQIFEQFGDSNVVFLTPPDHPGL